MAWAEPPRELRTAGLRLRRWTDADRGPFAALNADPEVMEFLPKLLTRAESDEFVDRIEATFDEVGYGLWVVELEDGAFAGYVGLWPATFEAPFTPAIEVGWRLARHAWGKGVASTAARAAVDDGFARLDVDEILSFTAVANVRSRAVMERLGMVRDEAGDFAHPSLAEGHPLRPHVLYRLRRP